MTQDALPYVEHQPVGEHKATVIWLHGLGDSGNGFAPIVPELRLPDELGIRFIFPHAPVRPVTINGGMPMRAWYDIVSMDMDKRADLDGVKASAAQVQALIEAEIAAGIPSDKIILAGFSQGGVIATYLGPRFHQPLGGIMALSTYLCAGDRLASEANSANAHTPILMAHGEHDDVVPMALGLHAKATLEAQGMPVEWHQYPMQHNVCGEEVARISAWLQQRLATN